MLSTTSARVLLAFFALLLNIAGATSQTAPSHTDFTGGPFHTQVARDIDGNWIDFSRYIGRVVLVVNVASQCGYTSQYSELEGLQREFGSDGLTVMAFPCNQFGGQEPYENSAIKQFAQERFDVTFQMMEKVNVNGNGESVIYTILKRAISSPQKSIDWNFEKFLVDKRGQVVAHYRSGTKPEELKAKIRELLAQ